MVFFQALLLAGYFYAHRNTSQLPPRRQVAVHSASCSSPPGRSRSGRPSSARPSPVAGPQEPRPAGERLTLLRRPRRCWSPPIGVPFFVVSTTAPLCRSGSPRPATRRRRTRTSCTRQQRRQPARAARLPVRRRTEPAAGRTGLGVGRRVRGPDRLIAACGRAISNTPPPRAEARPEAGRRTERGRAGRRVADQAPLALLAFVPSSLMLGVTFHMTTDIASIPLLWVIPLALYLLTFIIVFSKSIPARLHLYVTLMTPVLVLLARLLRASQNVPQTELKISFELHTGPVAGHLLLRRLDLPRRAGPDSPRRPPPDRVLPDHVGRADARGAVQRPGRPARVHVRHRVPDQPGRRGSSSSRR